MLQGFLVRSSWRTPKAPKPNQRTTKMLWTRLQRMSSAHLLMYSTARCFGVKTELIFLRSLSSLDVDLISRMHDGSGNRDLGRAEILRIECPLCAKSGHLAP